MQDCQELHILSVATTVSSRTAAQALAREILSRRLAACVQIEEGLTSLYPWKGQLCEEPELRLVIKTLPGCEAGLKVLFAEHHPYEVPQFLAVSMVASPGYAEWVRAEVNPPAAGSAP